MILIDYLYYQIVNFYQHFNKDGAEKGYGVVIACGLPFLNIIFILMFLDHFYDTNILPSNKYVILIYSLPIILLIGLRYWKFTSYEQIKERIQNFRKTTRVIADILLVIYVTISLLGFIFFSLYLGSLKNTF
ncbi:hypothetical protein [Chryseobacterium sp. NFX27]|jgi:hypothetical protein|uniref:hypothetical protein n=1 Tax=Chryseobacterium sp. NFX27 TaxID=2819618 RepID=UPI003CE95B1F